MKSQARARVRLEVTLYGLYLGLLEVDEAQTSQSRTIALLDRDPFGDEVEFTEIEVRISLLMQVVDDANQTRFKLLDAIATADFADQTTDLLVEVLVSVHPRIDNPSRDELILLTVRDGKNRFSSEPKGGKSISSIEAMCAVAGSTDE